MSDDTKEKIAILDNCEVTVFHKFIEKATERMNLGMK